MTSRRIKQFSAIVVLLCVGGIIWKSCGQKSGDKVQIETIPASRGDLKVSIQATGTVEPEEVIDVGAQVVGLVLAFGTDANGKQVDYGSTVTKGMVLAQIDPSLYESDFAQAEAQLARAHADVEQLKAKLFQAERDWVRAQKLGTSEALSKSSFDSYDAAFRGARASLAVGDAQVVQAKATLARAKRNLELCVIHSPVDGIIIDRRVNIGQTVVSNLNTPSLFLIARDLKRMEVWASVNEADIGKIVPGQVVRFSVDAFPDKEFHGNVKKVRLNAAMNQNVVTYLVEVSTDNSSGSLLPYLTAKTYFDVAERKAALLIPNAALRYAPSAGLGATKERVDKAAQQAPEEEKGTSIIWVNRENTVIPVRVKTGLSDGISTEVLSGELSENDLVIVGERTKSDDDDSEAKTVNPFAPSFQRGGAKR